MNAVHLNHKCIADSLFGHKSQHRSLSFFPVRCSHLCKARWWTDQHQMRSVKLDLKSMDSFDELERLVENM